jgi:hypothetical protein
VPAGEQVTVPAQHRLKRPVGRGEPNLLTMQLSLQDGDLMSEGEYFDVLGVVAHRQQP